jgi:hypothetical protein
VPASPTATPVNNTDWFNDPARRQGISLSHDLNFWIFCIIALIVAVAQLFRREQWRVCSLSHISHSSSYPRTKKEGDDRREQTVSLSSLLYKLMHKFLLISFLCSLFAQEVPRKDEFFLSLCWSFILRACYRRCR